MQECNSGSNQQKLAVASRHRVLVMPDGSATASMAAGHRTAKMTADTQSRYVLRCRTHLEGNLVSGLSDYVASLTAVFIRPVRAKR